MRFTVEQLNGDDWTLVATDVEADGPHAAELAAARGARDAGIYRVRVEGDDGPGKMIRLPPYGLPEAVG
jgi:hypothetical protein